MMCVVFLLHFPVKGFQQLFAVAEVVFTGGGGIGIFLYNAVLGGCTAQVEQNCQISNMVYLIALSFMVMVCDLGHGLILWSFVSQINFLCCKFTKIMERVFKCNALYGKAFPR